MNLNTLKNRKIISTFFKKDIIDMQTAYNNKEVLEVLIFWKKILWFKGRCRLDINYFYDIIEGKI